MEENTVELPVEEDGIQAEETASVDCAVSRLDCDILYFISGLLEE